MLISAELLNKNTIDAGVLDMKLIGFVIPW